jgi:hypothetical protein
VKTVGLTWAIATGPVMHHQVAEDARHRGRDMRWPYADETHTALARRLYSATRVWDRSAPGMIGNHGHAGSVWVGTAFACRAGSDYGIRRSPTRRRALGPEHPAQLIGEEIEGARDP